MERKVKFSGIYIIFYALLLNIINYSCSNQSSPKISIVVDRSYEGSVMHGLEKLTDALEARKISFEKVGTLDEAKGEIIITAGLSEDNSTASQMLKAGDHSVPQVPEALTILKTKWQKKLVWIISGFDGRGLMYALLDVADRIKWSENPQNPMSEVKEITEQPDATERAVSIYTMNRAWWESRFYDEKYWEKYLDNLARNRFNSLVLIFGYENGGFLAPCYPYFFDVESFPDVRMVGLTADQQQRNLSSLKLLIKMAHERGIGLTLGIWDHIYRGGIQGMGIRGSENALEQPTQGLVWGVRTDNLIDYTKAAITKLLQVVPDIDGIQFRMHSESGLKNEELDDFWLDIFKEVKKTTPELRLDLRAKELPESVIKNAINVGIKFRITTKYWMEQMGMPWHPTQINPEKSPVRHSYGSLLRYPQQYQMHWRLWTGGTSRVLLWGDPEYVRRFVESTHLYDGNGFEVNEPLATKMEAQPHDTVIFNILNPQYRYYDYEFERYWHFFQVFGRIGYNPETSPDVWHKEFELRFGKKAAPYIEQALHKASWILPRIVASCYPYSCFPTTRGWPEKQSLGELQYYARAEGSDIRQFANFDEEAQILTGSIESAKTLPSMTSRWLLQTYSEINTLINKAEKAIGKDRSKEFNSTVTDLKILSNLALYHSRRIPAAVSYRLFELTKDVSALDKAIEYERNAIEAWRLIVESAGDYYTDNMMMGLKQVGFQGLIHRLTGHWKDELGYLEEGLLSLEQKRLSINLEDVVMKAPQYIETNHSDNDHLFKISHKPVTSADTEKPIDISIKVTASAGVKWVRLLYRSVNQDTEYKTVTMESSDKKDTYMATVPADEINPVWDFMYLIEIMDKNGKGTIYPGFDKETPYIITKLNRKL
jgi:hypothetical protein